MADLENCRTLVAVGLRKEGTLFGMITALRQEIRPFSDKQIALLENFAAQAVIAIENARLLIETREALEQQTATAEVLQIINSSPGDLAPVFDAILKKARRLCGADVGTFWTFDGGRFYPTVVSGAFNRPVRALQAGWRPGPNVSLGRVMAGENTVHVIDVKVDAGYQSDPEARARTNAAGSRTVLTVALRKDDRLLGAITTGRKAVRPYSDRQIALLRNFAEQAVIAMENVRLITELRQRTRDLQESLEHQSGTSDVLQVISRSTFDLQPVLDTLVETAARICDADKAVIHQVRDGLYWMAASFGFSREYNDYGARNPIAPGRGTTIGRMALERRAVQIEDWLNDPEHVGAELGQLSQVCTGLAVPLFREDAIIGCFFVARSHVEPFTEKQIALVTTFADQAVIAIENTRLITETREALEQQTATAELLEVINRSPGELAPVFDAMLEKAVQLCGGANGILWTLDGERARLVGSRNSSPEVVELLRRQGEAGEHPLLRRGIAGEHLFQFDLAEHEVYHSGAVVAARDIGASGVRTVIWVALVKSGAAVGAFVISRNELR